MDKVRTKYGEFTACNDASDLRKKYRCPVEYHLNGNIKSIYLQEPEEISLPEGKFQAELITFYEDGNTILTFDHVYSIDRQIQIYETIYDHRNQLSYYQLDWSNYFKALRVKDEEGKTVWRILTSEEARHLWYNGRWCDMCQLFLT